MTELEWCKSNAPDAFSAVIDKSRYRYDYAFNVSENVYTDCTFFIECILEVILLALRNCLEVEGDAK